MSCNVCSLCKSVTLSMLEKHINLKLDKNEAVHNIELENV